MVRRQQRCEIEFEAFDRNTAEDDPYWSLTSVKAPWLDKLGTHAEYGVFCNTCVANGVHHMIPSAPNLSVVPFMKQSDLAKHICEVTQDVRLAE